MFILCLLEVNLLCLLGINIVLTITTIIDHREDIPLMMSITQIALDILILLLVVDLLPDPKCTIYLMM